jgi:hypothetical protein
VRATGPGAVLTEFRPLLSAGMATVRGKLQAVPEERFVARLVELWGFFFGTVLPYVHGIFEALRLDAAAVHALPWVDDATSPGALVRDTILIAFRDDVLLPCAPRLPGLPFLPATAAAATATTAAP